MNILFISTQFPNSKEPNRGIFSYQIVNELSLLADVKVIAPLPTIGYFKFLDRFKKYKTNINLPRFEMIKSIPVYHPKYIAFPGVGLLHALEYQRSIEALVSDINKNWPISAVNCHWLFPDGVAVRRICEKLNIPLMLSALGTDLNQYCQYKIRGGFIKRALSGANKVSVLNLEMFNKCVAMGVPKEKLVVIPNGVNVEKFSIKDKALCREKLGIDWNLKMLLFVGALVPVKNVSTLINAVALLEKNRSSLGAKLYIVGSGFLEYELKKLVNELKMNDRIIFIGQVEHDDLPLWMNAADCLCLPSLSEGHPNVMMEALACGTQVVGSNVGAIPDFVSEEYGNGYTVDGNDIVDISNKLFAALTLKKYPEEVRNKVLPFSWGNCAKHYYEELFSMST